jgi:hypothetical protein
MAPAISYMSGSSDEKCNNIERRQSLRLIYNYRAQRPGTYNAKTKQTAATFNPQNKNRASMIKNPRPNEHD